MTAKMDEAINSFFVFFSPLCDTHGTRHLRQPMSTIKHASLQYKQFHQRAGCRAATAMQAAGYMAAGDDAHLYPPTVSPASKGRLSK